MAYEKQIWNKYDDLKTEEENIENGAVVTDNRMNHIEEGIEAHTADLKNPHSVTAAQVGLGNVQNFGLATEDEAKQGISNAKYMTPSLTQAVLSTNINSIAYANSADGTDGFTTVYPNLNLLTDSKDFKNKNVAESAATTSITSSGSTILKEGNDTYLNFIKSTQSQDWFRAYMIRGSSVSPNFPNVDVKPNSQYTFSVWLKGTGIHQIIAYDKWTNPNPTTLTVNLTDTWTKYVLTVNTGTTIPTQGAQFFIRSGTVGSEINLKYPKVESGSTATPYMPSSSEVTTADWPKYIGFSNTVKTNKSASDYTWFPVKDSELTNKVDSHINNKSNPHGVTAGQVGAYSKTEADSKLSLKANDSEVVHNTGDETISGSKSFYSIAITDTLTERTTTVDITGFYTLTLTLRRTGNDVELISTRTTISSATGHEQTDAGFTIPSGFRPISRALAKVEMSNSTTMYNPMILRLDSDGKTYLTNEAFSNTRYAQCYANWKTTDPWPTSN